MVERLSPTVFWSLRAVVVPILPYVLSIVIFLHQGQTRSVSALNLDTLAFAISAIATWMAYTLSTWRPPIAERDPGEEDARHIRIFAWIGLAAFSLIIFSLVKVGQASEGPRTDDVGEIKLVLYFIYLVLSAFGIYSVFQHAAFYRLEDRRG